MFYDCLKGISLHLRYAKPPNVEGGSFGEDRRDSPPLSLCPPHILSEDALHKAGAMFPSWDWWHPGPPQAESGGGVLVPSSEVQGALDLGL